MKEIILYSYSKCSTCRKAAKWLDQNNITYELIDLVTNPPSKQLLSHIIKDFQLDKKKLFNTRGKNFKDLDLKDINNFPDEKVINLLTNDGKLIKRPLLVSPQKILFGFNENEYKSILCNENNKDINK